MATNSHSIERNILALLTTELPAQMTNSGLADNIYFYAAKSEGKLIRGRKDAGLTPVTNGKMVNS